MLPITCKKTSISPPYHTSKFCGSPKTLSVNIPTTANTFWRCFQIWQSSIMQPSPPKKSNSYSPCQKPNYWAAPNQVHLDLTRRCGTDLIANSNSLLLSIRRTKSKKSLKITQRHSKPTLGMSRAQCRHKVKTQWVRRPAASHPVLKHQIHLEVKVPKFYLREEWALNNLRRLPNHKQHSSKI